MQFVFFCAEIVIIFLSCLINLRSLFYTEDVLKKNNGISI